MELDIEYFIKCLIKLNIITESHQDSSYIIDISWLFCNLICKVIFIYLFIYLYIYLQIQNPIYKGTM
jgi:hypothetical protein